MINLPGIVQEFFFRFYNEISEAEILDIIIVFRFVNMCYIYISLFLIYKKKVFTEINEPLREVIRKEKGKEKGRHSDN